jgi:hypothetical protein
MTSPQLPTPDVGAYHPGLVRSDLWVMTTHHPHLRVNSPAIVEKLAGCFLLCGPSALPFDLMKV